MEVGTCPGLIGLDFEGNPSPDWRGEVNIVLVQFAQLHQLTW